MSESHSAVRALTLCRDPEAEARGKAALLALVSAAGDVAGDALLGAALGGPPAAGEGLATRGEDGAVALADPLELLVVLDASVRRAFALAKGIRKAAAEAAKARRANFSISAVARGELPFLPPTLATLEIVAANRVVAGPAALLAGAPDPSRVAPSPLEGLRLLVRCGAALLTAERAVDRSPSGEPARAALRTVGAVDLGLGAAVLLPAGRWVPGLLGRDERLRDLGRRGGDDAAKTGFQGRMTWTRFRDILDRHHAAVEAREQVEERGSGPDARRQVARAIDRWLEVLRLFEEERLGVPLPDWTEYACVLEARRKRLAEGSLFDPESEAEERAALGLPARRAVRGWEPAERVAPALAALLDWDPGDLPVAAILLDLPDDASRDALRHRAAAFGREV